MAVAVRAAKGDGCSIHYCSSFTALVVSALVSVGVRLPAEETLGQHGDEDALDDQANDGLDSGDPGLGAIGRKLAGEHAAMKRRQADEECVLWGKRVARVQAKREEEGGAG